MHHNLILDESRSSARVILPRFCNLLCPLLGACFCSKDPQRNRNVKIIDDGAADM